VTTAARVPKAKRSERGGASNPSSAIGLTHTSAVCSNQRPT
jgi:hypothetical protein